MKQTVNFSMFCDAFNNMGRGDNFSYEGLKALFNYLEEMEENTGEEIELDVIALCCKYTEYDNTIEAAGEYGEKYEDEDEALEYLKSSTTVIEFVGGIIIRDF